jgi:hypothetical protein
LVEVTIRADHDPSFKVFGRSRTDMIEDVAGIMLRVWRNLDAIRDLTVSVVHMHEDAMRPNSRIILRQDVALSTSGVVS